MNIPNPTTSNPEEVANITSARALHAKRVGRQKVLRKIVLPLILHTMLGLRWLKRTVFLNRDSRRYVGYAIGEVLLVIVGILIALQINNWNSERQDRATLDSYLRTIADNMLEDIHMLERLHTQRSETILLATNASSHLLRSAPSLRVEELLYLAQAMRAAEGVAYFNTNTSGFDALKNSGVLDKLQGKDVEMLLSRYYVGSVRIGQLEQAHNARIMAALSLPVEDSNAPVENFALTDPTALMPGRFEELQEYFDKYYSGQYPRRLLENGIAAAPILREYEKLLALARLFTEMAKAGSRDFDNHARRTLADIDALEQGAGHPNVVRNGRLSLGHYLPHFAYPYYVDGEFRPREQYVDHDFVSQVDGVLQITLKSGAPWASIFFAVRDRSNSLGRPSLDYSRFDRILFEARGANGGERLLLLMKDKDDPDDGSQTNLEIVLSEQWSTHEFRLSDFKNADLSKLSAVLGFLTVDQTDPLSFDVRTVRFLEPDE